INGITAGELCLVSADDLLCFRVVWQAVEVVIDVRSAQRGQVLPNAVNDQMLHGTEPGLEGSGGGLPQRTPLAIEQVKQDRRARAVMEDVAASADHVNVQGERAEQYDPPERGELGAIGLFVDGQLFETLPQF